MTLDSEQRAFLHTGVAIEVASHDANMVPVVARAVAARVSADGTRVTLFVSRTLGARCLNAIGACRAVAAVFCHPSTLRTIQLKGGDAALEPVSGDDVTHVKAMVSAFVAEVRAIGHSEALALLDVAYAPGDLVGVTFAPEAAFVQTPGPAAGARL
jgi:hypothetical protein